MTWFRDDIQIRAFEESDNSSVSRLEIETLRGGIPVGLHLKAPNVTQKGTLYSKAFMLVACKIKLGAQIRASSLSPGGSSEAKSHSTGTKSVEIIGFCCGSLEKVSVFRKSGLRKLSSDKSPVVMSSLRHEVKDSEIVEEESVEDLSSIGWIVDLMVQLNCSRKNVGSRLIQDLEGRLKRSDRSLRFLLVRVPEANTAALNLFTKHGFTSMCSISIYGWMTERKVVIEETVSTKIELNTEESIRMILSSCVGFDMLPEERTLRKKIVTTELHGGMVFGTHRTDEKSWAQVAIFNFLELYRARIGTRKGIFSAILSMMKKSVSSTPQLHSICILYAMSCEGPNGLYVLRQTIAEAHNRCIDIGASMIFVAHPSEHEEFGIDELFPASITCKSSMKMLGKPISEKLPVINPRTLFVDPRF